MDELIVEFLGETSESLDVIDVELVKFENDPTNRATLDNIFRLLHTIKGTCGFLGLTRLEALAHAGETLLGKFRDGDMIANSAAVTVVLKSIDRLKEILGGLEETGNEPAGDDTDLITKLEDLSMGKAVEVGSASAGEDASAPAAEAPEAAPAAEPEAKVISPSEAEPEAPAAEEGGERYDTDLDRPLRPGEVSLADLEAAFQNTESDHEAEVPADDEDDEADAEPEINVKVADDPQAGREAAAAWPMARA